MMQFRQDVSEVRHRSAARAILVRGLVLAAGTAAAILSGGLACGKGRDQRLCQAAHLKDPIAYTKAVENARSERDSLYHDPKTSPVAKEDLPGWKGLEFYPVKPSYVLEGRLVRRLKPIPLKIPDTGGETREAEEIGYFLVDLGAGPEKLTVFHMLQSDSLFLPFLDATSGEETYPAGRYLELQDLGQERYRLDFNLAYNPYCAYGGDWSCPITPQSNRLKAAIRAGERGYKYLHQ